jgi:hypothetical protein
MVVLGDLFGDDAEGAMTIAGWLAFELKNDPHFQVVVGDEDVPVLWPDHPRAELAVKPEWGAKVRHRLAPVWDRLRLVTSESGVWYSHAGVTSTAVVHMRGLTDDTVREADARARQALDDNDFHPLLDVRTGVLDSNWRKNDWMPSVLQGLAHPADEPNKAGHWMHPQYKSGVIYVHGTGYAEVRDGRQVILKEG